MDDRNGEEDDDRSPSDGEEEDSDEKSSTDQQKPSSKPSSRFKRIDESEDSGGSNKDDENDEGIVGVSSAVAALSKSVNDLSVVSSGAASVVDRSRNDEDSGFGSSLYKAPSTPHIVSANNSSVIGRPVSNLYRQCCWLSFSSIHGLWIRRSSIIFICQFCALPL